MVKEDRVSGVTLFTAGRQTIMATDTVSGINGSATTTVTPASADHFQVSAPGTVPSGIPFDVTVTAQDPYGNIDTNYTGTVTFSSSDGDPGVVLPADYTFQPGDLGSVTFSGGVTLITPGDQTVMATDTVSGITGSATVTVTQGPLVLMWESRLQPPEAGALTPPSKELVPVSLNAQAVNRLCATTERAEPPVARGSWGTMKLGSGARTMACDLGFRHQGDSSLLPERAVEPFEIGGKPAE